MLNSQQATVERLSEKAVRLQLGDDRRIELDLDSRTMRKIDLAYAINAYSVQGLTTANAVIAMDSREKLLASSRNLHVAVTRVADQMSLFVDSAEGLGRAVERNSGEKTSALELYQDLIAKRDQQTELGGHVQRGAGQPAEKDEFRLGPNPRDFEKERDYAKELTKALGIEAMTKARGRDWDISM